MFYPSRHHLPAIALCSGSATHAHPTTQVRIPDQCFKLGGQGLHLFVLEEHAFLTVPHHTPIAFNVRRHHRLASGHRFEQYDTEALSARSRRAKDIRRGVVPRKVVVRHSSYEFHILEVLRTQDMVGVLVGITRTDDQQPQVRNIPLETAIRLQKISQTLSFLETSHKDDVGLAVLVLRPWNGPLREVVDVNTIGDDLVVSWEKCC